MNAHRLLTLVLWYVLTPMGTAAALYMFYLIWHGWTETKGAPREDMFFCQKHGFIRAGNVIRFEQPMDVAAGYDEKGKEIIKRQIVEYCPLCFHGNMKAAERMQ